MRFKLFILACATILVVSSFFLSWTTYQAGVRAGLKEGGAHNLPEEVKLDADDDGRQIEFEKNQILVIALEANPTTGYTWEIAELEEQVLRQVGEVDFEPESEAIGAPGIQTLRFEAVNVGKTTLKLVYRRPWEEDVEPLDTFSIKVVVR